MLVSYEQHVYGVSLSTRVVCDSCVLIPTMWVKDERGGGGGGGGGGVVSMPASLIHSTSVLTPAHGE